MSAPAEPRVVALLNEAGLAAESIAFGATILGNADYARQSYYAQSFFSLSVGFERSGKLALALDHALDNGGTFPNPKVLRGYGHDLTALVANAESIAKRRGVAAPRPSTTIHDAILATLTDFASNLTRYYNLEFLAGLPAAVGRDSPTASWYRDVSSRITAQHYNVSRRARDEARAQALDAMTVGYMSVRYHAETGDVIRSVYEGSRRSAERQAVVPWERMYVLQFGRFFGEIVGELADAARYTVPDIPFLGEFFASFQNDDAYFRSKKTWSTY